MVEVNGSVVVVGGVDPASGSPGQLETEILREGGNRSADMQFVTDARILSV